MTDEGAALTLGCGAYDRTRPFLDEAVDVDGVPLTITPLSSGPMFQSAARLDFDVIEHSLATIVMQHGPDSPYVPLPIFPSRAFRHNGIYVRADSSFTEPSDLCGGRVGITGYTVTGMVWIRGMLEEHHGLPADAVTYVNGGIDAPGAPPLRGARPPAGVTVVDAPEGVTLTELLAAKEIEAIYAIHAPHAFGASPATLRRLFTDVRAEEEAYFSRTGFFPLMHVLAVQRAVLERHPGLPAVLRALFDRGKAVARAELEDTGALKTMLPWAYCDLERARSEFGDAFWEDGVDANRANLETFVRYCAAQGLIGAPVDLDELFPVPLDAPRPLGAQ